MQSLNLGSVEDFPFLEAPPKRAIADGYQLLNELGATDDQNALTTIGRELARLPLDPRIGRMILEARGREALREVLIVASALSVQDVRDRPLEQQQAADQAHAKFDDDKSEFLGTLKLWTWLEHSRGGPAARRAAQRGRVPSGGSDRRERGGTKGRASPVEPQARAAAARELHLAAPRARVARHPRPAAVGRHRARLARQRQRADLRAAAPVDARRPARQHRRQERRGRVVPRRARHPLLAPSGRAPVEEAGALDRRRRAGRDDAALRARHRRDRPALAAGARRPPHQDAAARAALGEEGGAGRRARAGDALRHRHLRQPARRLRHGRSGGGARDLHPRGARRRRVGDEAAVRRRQPEADRAGRGARAQVAPPGRARRRRADLRLLRPAAAGRRAQRPCLRALVPRRGEAPAAPAHADARRADAPRGRRHHDRGVPEDDPPRRRRLRRELPARARQRARRRHRDGADLRPQSGERGALRVAGARHAQGKDRRPRQDLAAAAALAPRAAARVRAVVHRRGRLRRGQPARCARRARGQAHRPAAAARRFQARAARAAPAHEPARRRRARPPARRIAPTSPS